nr:M20/M25/M40 family metallo-hydrolase [uncultured Sellimonas sp.]
MPRDMEESIHRFLEKYRDEIVENVCRLVRIPSIESEKEEIYPYGKECAKALDFCADLAKEKGLVSENYQYYGLEIRPWEKAEGKRLLLAGHVDVVVPSNEDLYPSFGGTVDRGYIIGRGAVDDKGPLLALFYALVFLKEEGIHPNCDVRLFAGAHEETDMKDIEYYLEKAGQPDFGIAADDDFPITNGEKSVLWFRLKSDRPCLEIWKRISEDPTGNELGIESVGGQYGNSRCKIRKQEDTWAEIDIRFPMTMTIGEAKEKIYEFADRYGLQVEFIKEDEGYYISENEGIPKLLIQLHHEIEQSEDSAYIMEGCTYARKFRLGCGFGAGRQNERKPFPKGHGQAHGADEAQNIDALMRAVRLYILAILAIDDYWITHS